MSSPICFAQKQAKEDVALSEYTSRELLEAIYEVRDRCTRIEEKLNRAEKLEVKVDDIESKVDNANSTAEKALMMAENNKEQIQAIKKENMWAWGFVITALLGIVAQYLGIGK